MMKEWQIQYENELERAESAQAGGNEGQARVCARRAAGIAIREYYTRRGKELQKPSAYDLLHMLLQDPSCPTEVRQSAEYLTTRVNEEFKLPVNVDLLAEARKLCDGLLAG